MIKEETYLSYDTYLLTACSHCPNKLFNTRLGTVYWKRRDEILGSSAVVFTMVAKILNDSDVKAN